MVRVVLMAVVLVASCTEHRARPQGEADVAPSHRVLVPTVDAVLPFGEEGLRIVLRDGGSITPRLDVVGQV